MSTFGIAANYDKVDFEELTYDEVEIISGGTGAAGGIVMGIAGAWASTVAGAAVGATVGGPVGFFAGAAAGFVLGSAIAVGYALASSGG